MDNGLRTFQLNLKNMLDGFDHFCQAHKLPYCLIGGSVLGAVRHKGFIPWDDDIDVALLRPDFERMEQIAASLGGYIGENLYYEPVEGHSFPNSPLGYLYDVSNKSLPLQECPTIDVFPLDGVPNSHFKQQIQRIFSYIYHLSIYRQPARNRGEFNRKFTAAVIRFTPKCMFSFYIRLGKKVIAHWNVQKTDFISNIFGQAGFWKEIMPKEYIGTPVLADFEGSKYPIPQDAHHYLTHLYGDYMRLPPIEQRVPKHKEYLLGETQDATGMDC